MSEAIDVILRRRSCRKFEPMPIPREKIEIIVQCARSAPTAMNRQQLNFYPIISTNVLREIGEETEPMALAKFPHLQERKRTHEVNVITYGATAALAITVPKTLPEGQSNLDVGLAAQNALLACEALGLAAIPVLIVVGINEQGVMKRIKADSENERLALVIFIGVPSPVYKQTLMPQKTLTSQVHWV